jgi:RNA polymerase sigma-70 factor, ECF subfamily
MWLGFYPSSPILARAIFGPVPGINLPVADSQYTARFAMAFDPAKMEQCGPQAGRATSLGAECHLAKMVDEHHASLYRYAYRLSGTAADAEDLTQQVFLVAQQKLDQVRFAECVRGWLYAVLRNCYLKSKRRPTPLAATGLAMDLETLPGKISDDDIDREQLQAAINELPDEFKFVVLMFYFEDYSYREIAERLELPIGTVMSRLSRAKGHLRRRLLAECDSYDSDTKRLKNKLTYR